MSRQPIWKCVANLGDANPLLHGGFFVYVDTTGVYDPECDLLEVEDEYDGRSQKYTEYRCVMEQHTLLAAKEPRNPFSMGGGVLSENTFHPDSEAWYADVLDRVDCCCGNGEEDCVARRLLSNEPVERAFAYRDLISYFGPGQFDSYPLTLSKAECKKRYPKEIW